MCVLGLDRGQSHGVPAERWSVSGPSVGRRCRADWTSLLYMKRNRFKPFTGIDNGVSDTYWTNPVQMKTVLEVYKV